MIYDYKDLDSDNDDDDEIHPNIDKASFLKWKAAIREQKKLEIKERIKFLECKECSENEKFELEKLKHLITPKIREVGSSSRKNIGLDVDFSDHFINLCKNTDIKYFNNYILNKCFDNDMFEDFVLANLIENIKDGNDEGSKIIARIAMYFKYLNGNGMNFMKKLEKYLENDNGAFDSEVDSFYMECKERLKNNSDE